jgi:hypothetical protein
LTAECRVGRASLRSYWISLTCYATASYSAVTQPQTNNPQNNTLGRPDDPNIFPQTSTSPNVVEGGANIAATQHQSSGPRNEVDGVDGAADAQSGDLLHVMCGPLLNYQGMTEEGRETVWHGSVLLVVEPGMQVPQLRLRKRGPVTPTDTPETKGFFSRAEKSASVDGLKLYADPIKTFWRFTLRVPLGAVETRWEYAIPNMHFHSEVSSSPSRDFVVPAASQSMRLMFHSCNGFSVGTDLDYWTGEANPLC